MAEREVEEGEEAEIKELQSKQLTMAAMRSRVASVSVLHKYQDRMTHCDN